VEAVNRALIAALGAPAGTWNIERLLRLPGTVNYPNAVKRRSVIRSTLIETNTAVYPLSAFPKELSAAASEGKPILNLNNIDHDLDSADLAQMITEQILAIRPFGKNDQTRECDCRAMTIYANGNNLHVIGALVRRNITCRMKAHKERPELREF
jgi:hypothetical protein